MSEEIKGLTPEEMKDLTPEEREAKERLDQKLAGCTSEDEAYRVIMGEMNSDSNGELDETALDMVAGGMSAPEAIKIITVSYWDLCVRKRMPPYSRGQIDEALRIGDKLHSQCPRAMWWCVKKLLGL